jgi:hypothetical protein
VDAPTLHLQYDQYRVEYDDAEVFGPGFSMSGFPWPGGNEVQFEPGDWYDQFSGMPPAPLPMPDGGHYLHDVFSSNRGYEYTWGFNVDGGNFGQIGDFPGSSSTNTPEKLIGHWKFNAGAGTNAVDSTTNHLDGVLLGVPLPTWTSGVFSNALSFDGSQNRVSVSNTTVLTPQNAFTIMTWIKPSAISKVFPVAKWGTNGVSGSYRLGLTSTNVQFQVYLNGSLATLAGTKALSLTNWHHIAGIYTGTNLRLYIDGELDSSLSHTGTVDLVSTPLIMGGVNGSLDEVRLFNFALSSDIMWFVYRVDRDVDGMPDVWEINHGLNPLSGNDNWEDSDNDGWMNLEEYWYGTHPNNTDTDGDGIADTSDSHPTDYYNGVLPRLAIVSGNNQSGQTSTFLSAPLIVQLQDEDEQPLVNAPVTLAVTLGDAHLAHSTNASVVSSLLTAGSDTNGHISVFLLLPSDPGTNSVKVTARSGGNSTNVTFTGIALAPASAPPELIGHWMFDESTSTNALDSTTNNHHGVLIGSPLPSWTSGVFSNALSFDGVQNEVAVPSSANLSPPNALTVSAWVRPVSTNGDFTVAKWATNDLSGSYLLWASPTNAALELFLNGTNRTLTGTTYLSISNWHHLAGVFNSTQLLLYVDGALDTNAAASGTVDVVSEPLRMGGVKGGLDDVRLYNYALASTNVLALYETDTDGDGIPNVWEVNHGLNPNANDASSDPDGDGLTNLQEYQQGNDPNDYYNGALPTLVIVSGNNQVGLTNSVLTDPLVLDVQNASQQSLSNAPVSYTTSGGAQVSTNSSGPWYTNLNLRTHSPLSLYALTPPSAGLGTATATATSGASSTSATFGMMAATNSCIEQAMRAVQERYNLSLGGYIPWPNRTYPDGASPGNYPPDGFYCADLASNGVSKAVQLIQSIANWLAQDAFINQFVYSIEGEEKIKVHSTYVFTNATKIGMGNMPLITITNCSSSLATLTNLTAYIGQLSSFLYPAGYTNTQASEEWPYNGEFNAGMPAENQSNCADAIANVLENYWIPGPSGWTPLGSIHPEVWIQLSGQIIENNEVWYAAIAMIVRQQLSADLRTFTNHSGTTQSYLRVTQNRDDLADTVSCPVTVDSKWHSFEPGNLGGTNTELITSFLPNGSGDGSYTPEFPACPSIDPELGYGAVSGGWVVADKTLVVTPDWQHNIGPCQQCGISMIQIIGPTPSVTGIGLTAILIAMGGGSSYTWTSSDTSKATVGADPANPGNSAYAAVVGQGLSTAVGDVVISVESAGNCVATWPLTVVGVGSVSPTSRMTCRDQTFLLGALPTLASFPPGQPVWTVDQPVMGYADPSDGPATIFHVGNYPTGMMANVMANCGASSKTCTVTGIDVRIHPNSFELNFCAPVSSNFQAFVYPPGGTLTWVPVGTNAHSTPNLITMPNAGINIVTLSYVVNGWACATSVTNVCPGVTISPPTFVTNVGSSVTFGAIGVPNGGTYSWSPGGSNPTGTFTTITFTGIGPTNVSVTYTFITNTPPTFSTNFCGATSSGDIQ